MTNVPRPVGVKSSTGQRSTLRLARAELLRGCNIYHQSTVIRQRLHLGHLVGLRTLALGTGFADQFLDRFQKLRILAPGDAIRPAIVTKLSHRDGLPIEAALLEAIRAVDASVLAAAHSLDRIDFTALAQGETASDVLLIWETHSARSSRAASEAAFVGLMELLPLPVRPPLDGSFDERLQAAIEQAKRRRLSSTTAVLKEAAKQRGLPVETITGQHLRLGQGSRQHQLYSSMTGFTSISAVKLANDKRQTNKRLEQLRLPVATQRRAQTATETRQAIRELGGQVVIKPQKANQGRGVTVVLEPRDDIDAVFERAAAAGSGVLVERFIPGVDHRLLVVDGRFVAALMRLPTTITGDGKRTAHDLIDEVNADPHRDGFRLYKVTIDETMCELLRAYGYELDDVLPKGEVIPLRQAADASNITIDVTDRVHPDNQRLAEHAASGIGLDVAGVDFITEDISRPYKESGGRIAEINARPGLCMHTWPRQGDYRDVAGVVVDLILKKGGVGDIPKLFVAGDRGLGVVARAAGALLSRAGHAVGLISRDVAMLNGQPVVLDTARKHRAVRTMLREPNLDSLVATVTMQSAVKRGLLAEHCDAVAILPRSDDRDIAIFRQGVELLIRANRGKFVVWSDDPIFGAGLQSLAPDRVILVARHAEDGIAETHRRAGRPTVLPIREGTRAGFALYDHGKLLLSSPLALGDEAARPIKPRDMEARLVAAALTYAAGINVAPIEKAITPPIPFTAYRRRALRLRRG